MDHTNFRYVAGTYLREARYQPSIACLKNIENEWLYYFVLVRRTACDSETDAQQHAEDDMEQAFIAKKSDGTDEAFARCLGEKGYVRVKSVKVSSES